MNNELNNELDQLEKEYTIIPEDNEPQRLYGPPSNFNNPQELNNEQVNPTLINELDQLEEEYTIIPEDNEPQKLYGPPSNFNNPQE